MSLSNWGPNTAWQTEHHNASEWVWHCPADTPLSTLETWCQSQAAASTKPLHLWLHHHHKQPAETVPTAWAATYASMAPGLNTVYVHPLCRLSLYLGATPEWPVLTRRSAYWSQEATAAALTATCPPWYAQPEAQPPEQVTIIGAGIAGASTAYALASQGIKVTVFDQGDIAAAASGNRQGLIYAKISPHLTPQSQLLLSGYGFTLRLLQQLLPQRQEWANCGVLHLDVTPQERKRNQTLAQWPYPELFHPLNQQQASSKAGLPLPCGGLFWPQGAWLHPPGLVAKLLAHPNISVHTHSEVTHISQHDGLWWLRLAAETTPSHSCTHLVLCQGHLAQQFLDLNTLPLTPIRGQVSHQPQPSALTPLKIALSGHSYISPPWQNQYCYGASFVANVTDTSLSTSEASDNLAALHTLCPDLAQQLDPSLTKGKAAIRCDSHDHLPLVGAIGDKINLRKAYAALAIDKTTAIADAHVWQPNLYINTAHGSRGLATAPLCGFALAHQIMGQSSSLSEALRQALHPNRFWIRQLVRRQA